jgi:hypothetical protein
MPLYEWSDEKAAENPPPAARSKCGASPRASWKIPSAPVASGKLAMMVMEGRPRLRSQPPPAPPDEGKTRVDAVLDASPERLSGVGRALLNWLEGAPPGPRQRAVSRLAQRLQEPWIDGPARDGNRLAALEILIWQGRPEAMGLVASRLGARPVSDSHLYLVPLPRLEPSADAPMRLAVAEQVVAVMDAAMGVGSRVRPELASRLAVEAFRTLAVIAPDLAVGPVCQHLSRFTGLEQTALWGAVAEAAARAQLGAARGEALRAAVQERWQALMTCPEPDDVDNFPGIAASLLELQARSGLDLGAPLAQVEAHRTMRPWIFHQLAQRNLDFLDRAARVDIYVRTVAALVERGEARSVATMGTLLAREAPETYLATMRRLLGAEPVDARP